MWTLSQFVVWSLYTDLILRASQSVPDKVFGFLLLLTAVAVLASDIQSRLHRLCLLLHHSFVCIVLRFISAVTGQVVMLFRYKLSMLLNKAGVIVVFVLEHEYQHGPLRPVSFVSFARIKDVFAVRSRE